MGFILQSVQGFESDESAPICERIYKIFNYYNGYGFDDLSAMSSDELINEITELFR